MLDGKRFIPVAKPVMDQSEVQAAGRAILSGWVTQGPEVAAFEREFAQYVDGKFACAVSSCTTALHLALLAVGVRPGDQVITVSHSFIATANSIRYCGATPVFVDIQQSTFNMDPNLIERAITERTKAILCVHQIGMPCDLKAIIEIAQHYSLRVVEDAACAIGSEILWDERWERIGKPHGDVACFSFHPRKLVSTGDGGMITTSNSDFDRQFRLWRQHGMSVPDTARHRSKDVIFESYVEVGYNYRLTDIQAAIGREQLKRLPEVLQRRRLMANRYDELLSAVPGILLPQEPPWARSNWQSYCVYLPEACNQKKVLQAMLDAGIQARRGVMCAHREPAYSRGTWSCGVALEGDNCTDGTCTRLTKSEKAQANCIVLPLFHQMTLEEQDQVVSTFREALQK